MYKNVSNQLIVGLFLLYPSCFLAVTARAQLKSANSTTISANADTKADQKPPNENISAPHQAQTDTTWKPVRRLWGFAFGDFYYMQHADAGNRGAETNYSGVPTYRNAFQFRRIYLGYDYDITRKFTAEVLLASEPAASTTPSGTTTISNGDNLADNKMAFYIKNFDLRWKGVWNGTDFLIGEMLTPAFPLLTEKIWGYRSIEKTISDFHRTNAYDVGVSLQGVFDPETKNFGYNILIGNNTTASLLPATNANTGFYKAFYGDVYAKFLNQTLIFDLYADYMQTAPATAALGGQSRNMLKGFVAYTTPKITFGLEAYTQKIVNGVTDVTAGKVGQDVTVKAISVYSHGAIYKDKVGFFARYDSYNPNTDFNAADVYTSNTNLAAYNPYYKEHFYTAGIDFTPAKNIHFMPNIWYIKYTDQRDPATTGYVADDHTLVYRLTFFYIFGK
ncbi:MAG TPA: hypothetical protein VGN20_25495 [Mucilaginibacter sp.]|jgi:hypothetical protein